MTFAQLIDALLVKQRRVFLGVLLATLIVTAAVTLALPKEYASTATLFVGENRPVATGANSVPLDEVLAQSYRDLLGTPEIERKAAQRLHVPTSAIAGKLSFDIATGTHLIHVTANDRAPARAARIANAYAAAFVADRRQSAATDDRDRVAALNREMRAHRLNVDPRTLAQIVQNNTLSGTNVSLASRATVPGSPTKPKPKLYLTLGAILALLLATGGALAVNALDTRVRDTDELEQVFNAPVVAMIPRARTFEADRDPILREALDFLQINLNLATAADRPLRSIAVSGATGDVGKTSIAMELSRTLARQGASVIGVDGDVRKPALAKRMRAKRMKVKLTDLLVDEELEPGLGATQDGVRVLGAGTAPPNPALLFRPARVRAIFDQLRESADYLIVDTPPVLSAAETSIIAGAADGVLVVIDAHDSKRRGLKAMSDQLSKAGATVVGLVLNRVPLRMSSYAYDSYYGTAAVRREPARAPKASPGAGRQQTSVK